MDLALTRAVFALALALGAFHVADGDPLEMYDFSGDAAVESFLQRQDSEVHRSGLWTIQHVRRLDPFGGLWHLESNREERVNVFYGSRPMWCSAWMRSAEVAFPDAPVRGDAPCWVTLDGRAGPPVVDVTGGHAATFDIAWWKGGQGAGQSGTTTVRLLGHSPATAAVEVLHECHAHARSERIDLDGDDVPELVTRLRVRLTSSRTSTLWGSTASIELAHRWDGATQRYRLDAPLTERLHDGRTRIDTEARRAALERVRESDTPHAERRAWTELREEIAQSAVRLIVLGRGADGADVVRRAPFEGGDEERARWWRELHGRLVAHASWPELCAAYPDLAALPADL